MEKEVEDGNYVICGGDFNHDLKADEAKVTKLKVGHIRSQEAKCHKG